MIQSSIYLSVQKSKDNDVSRAVGFNIDIDWSKY